MICNLCQDKGFIFHIFKQEYDVETCPCQQPKEIENETN
jgi:hypothetical protein